ncbi:MAG: zinc ribbon domain-containing protein [Candidatus Eisenbacteria bacterium]
MPLYEYMCRRCGARFEALIPVSAREQEEKKLACPKCGTTGPLRQISPFSTGDHSSEHRGCSSRRG